MMEQVCPAALERHTLENHKEERPIQKNCCVLTNHPPAPLVSFVKGLNVTCCDGRVGGEEPSGKK